MTSLAVSTPPRAQMDAWRRQIGHRHRVADDRGPRPFAVVSYLLRGVDANPRFVDLRRLLLVALFDERLATGQLVTRLVGVAGTVTLDGLHFGGPDLSRLDKDLRLAPAAGGRGTRLDAAEGTLLEFALGLERFFERCARHPYFPRGRTPRLPQCDGQADAGVIDLASFPKRQVIACDSPERDLVGHFGSTTFNLYQTRFHVAR